MAQYGGRFYTGGNNSVTHWQRFLDELKISMKLSGFLTNIAFAAGFVPLGMSYYKLWLPGQDIHLLYLFTVVTILTCIPSGAAHPLYYVYTLTVKKAFPRVITILAAFLMLLECYVLIQYAGMGVYAVAWTTVIVMMFINFVTNPLYMAHVLNIPYRTFYLDIIRNALSCVLLTAVFCGIASLYTPDTWLTLLLRAVIYALIGMLIHFVIVCSKQQWKIIKSAVLKRNLYRK